MYTCQNCGFQMDDRGQLPTRCPRCGTPTASAAPGFLPELDDGALGDLGELGDLGGPPGGGFGGPPSGPPSGPSGFGAPPSGPGGFGPGAPPPPPGFGPGPGAPPPPPSAAGGGGKTIYGMPGVEPGPPGRPSGAGGPSTAPRPMAGPGGIHDRMVELDADGPELTLDIGGGAADDLDLPAPVEDLDLPAPVERLDLPAPVDDLDLPAPVDDLDLPAPVDDFDLPAPALDLDLPAPVDDLPIPAENLPTPAENLPTPASPGLRPPAPPPADDFELDMDEPGPAPRVDRLPTDGDAASNLVDALEPEHRGRANNLPPRPGTEPPPGSPAPTIAPATGGGVSRTVIYGGIAAVLLAVVGGLYVSGVFDGEAPPPPAQKPPATGDSGGDEGPPPEPVPEGQVAERSEQVLARFDEETPASLQQAMAMSEQLNDRVGQAEAALLLHYRYGPDPVLAAQAQKLLVPHAAKTESHVTRVVGLQALAAGNLEQAAEKLAGEDPRSRLYKAWLHLAQGKADQAQSEAESVVAARDKSAAARLTIAEAAAQHDPTAGLARLREVADANKEYPRAQETLVRTLYELGYLGEASERAQAMEILGTTSADHQASLLVLKANIAREQGRITQAVQLLDEAVSKAPAAVPVKVERLRLLTTSRDFVTVRSDLEVLLRDQPQRPDVRTFAAEYYIVTGQGADALEQVEALAGLTPESATVPLLRGQVASMRGKGEEATAAFGAAREKNPLDPRATIEEAAMLAKDDENDEALVLLDAQITAVSSAEESSRRDAAHATLLRAKSELLLELGRQDDALAAADKAIVLNPSDNHARLLKGTTLVALGRVDAGEAALLELYERTGGFPGLTAPLARVYLRRTELDKLEKLLGDQLQDERAPNEILVAGSLLRVNQGKFEEARELADRALARDPGDWQAHVAKGQSFLLGGDPESGLLSMEQARPRKPQAEREMWYGQALEYNGRSKEALGYYKRAMELDPNLLEAAALYGRGLAYAGAAKAALEVLEPVCKKKNAPGYAFTAKGIAHKDLNQIAEAIAAFKRGGELDPESFENFYWWGRIESDRNKHAAAATALAKAVEVGKAGMLYYDDAYRRLGDAYRAQKKNSEAKAAYAKYLEVAPPTATGRKEVERLVGEL